jgi:hypothetical protein
MKMIRPVFGSSVWSPRIRVRVSAGDPQREREREKVAGKDEGF